MAPGAPAAIMTGRSIEMISGILGVLKAGGNYLPINPDAPVERIKYMLRDCRCSAALSDNKSISKIKSEIKFAGVIRITSYNVCYTKLLRKSRIR